MSQPWDKEFRSPRPRKRLPLRKRLSRKIEVGIFAITMVACCYMAVAKSSVNTNKKYHHK